ncbi:MAG: HU family DNA-binding protein [Muribaculaceae bacterium]|nr:HU family DNA-binding protein [Muribaculaceae bacterium]
MNNKITFPRLASLLAEHSGRSKRFSEDFLREFFALISETLEAQESVKIKGLGTFSLSRVEPRRSVDVTTGEPMEIDGHIKVVFTPSKELAEAVNSPFEAFTAIEISDDVDIDQLFTPEEIQVQNDNENEDNSSDIDFKVVTTEGHEETDALAQRDLTISFTKEEQESELEEDYDFQVIDTTAQEQVYDNEEESEHDEQKANFVVRSDAPEKSKAQEEPDANETLKTQEETDDDQNNSEAEENLNTHEGEGSQQESQTSAVSSEENLDEEPSDSQTEETENEDADTASEISEDLEEFEIQNSRRKNWVKGLLIVFGAAVVALLTTFAIWYFFATNDFNGFFKKSQTASADKTAGFVVGGKIIGNDSITPEAAVATDSAIDSTQESESEVEVPTAPSDAVVYDTIGTTRYLTTMAKAHYGNYNLWPYIYQENQSFLGHPDRIRPGTPVVIPKLSKYGVDPNNSADIEKAKKLGVEIYARYGKKI